MKQIIMLIETLTLEQTREIMWELSKKMDELKSKKELVVVDENLYDGRGC